jgi:hypothetical protein
MGRAALALAAVVGIAAPSWAEDLVFVVSSEVSIEINKDLVKDVYWGRRLYWPKIGKQVKLCLRAAQSPLNDVLLRDFLMTSQQRYDRYWKSQMLAGRSSGMENLKDLDAVIDQVLPKLSRDSLRADFLFLAGPRPKATELFRGNAVDLVLERKKLLAIAADSDVVAAPWKFLGDPPGALRWFPFLDASLAVAPTRGIFEKHVGYLCRSSGSHHRSRPRHRA